MQSSVFLKVWMETQEALNNKIAQILNDMQASEIVVKENNDELCRVCLATGRIPIYGESYGDILEQALNSLTGIKIRAAELYPRHLCVPCYVLLQIAVIFRRTAQKTYENLKTQSLHTNSDECMSDNNAATKTDDEECNLHKDKFLQESSDISKDEQLDTSHSGSELEHLSSTSEESDDYTNGKQQCELEIEVSDTNEEAVTQESSHISPESIYLINEDEISTGNDIEIHSSHSNGNYDTLPDYSADPISDITSTEKNIEEHEKSNQIVSVPIEESDTRDNNVAEENDDEIPRIDSAKKNSKYLSLQDYINKYVPNLLKITNKIDRNYPDKHPKPSLEPEKNNDSKHIRRLTVRIPKSSSSTVKAIPKQVSEPTEKNPVLVNKSDSAPTHISKPYERIPMSANESDNSSPNQASQQTKRIPIYLNKSDSICNYLCQPTEENLVSVNESRSIPKYVSQSTKKKSESVNETYSTSEHFSKPTEKNSVSVNITGNNKPIIKAFCTRPQIEYTKIVNLNTLKNMVSHAKPGSIKLKKIIKDKNIASETRTPENVNDSGTFMCDKQLPIKIKEIRFKVTHKTDVLSQPTKEDLISLLNEENIKSVIYPAQMWNKILTNPVKKIAPMNQKHYNIVATENNLVSVVSKEDIKSVSNTAQKPENVPASEDLVDNADDIKSVSKPAQMWTKIFTDPIKNIEAVDQKKYYIIDTEKNLVSVVSKEDVNSITNTAQKPQNILASIKDSIDNDDDKTSVTYPAQMLDKMLTNLIKKIKEVDQKNYNTTDKNLVSVVSKEDINSVSNTAQKSENDPASQKDLVDNDDDIKSVTKPAQMLLKILTNPVKAIPRNQTSENVIARQTITETNMDGLVSKSSWRNKKIFKCDECELPPHGLNEHLAHYRTKHPHKKFKCPICQKSYSSGYIERHMHDHEKGAFICEICGKITLTEKYFWLHRAIHSKELPFKCDLCPYRGRFHSSIKGHMKSHLGIKTYLCEYCPRQFINSGNLSLHMFTHKSERPYECKICKRKYATNYQLKRHIKSVHLGMRVICRFCGKRFTTKSSLSKHEILVHNRKKYAQPEQSLFIRFEKEKLSQIQA